MFKLVSIIAPDFPKKEAEMLFEENSDIFKKFDISNFDELLKIVCGFMFAVYINKTLIGFLFVTDWEHDKKQCEIGGFAYRHNAEDTVKSINTLTDFIFKTYKIDTILSRTFEKPAILCLLRAGFKKIDDNYLKLERGKHHDN